MCHLLLFSLLNMSSICASPQSYVHSFLFIFPTNLYCPLQPFSPPLHPSFVKGVCFSISCRVLYLKCLLFVCPAPVVSSSHWFNVQPDALETSALIQSGNPRAYRKTQPKQAPNSSVQSKSVMGRRLNHPVLP